MAHKIKITIFFISPTKFKEKIWTLVNFFITYFSNYVKVKCITDKQKKKFMLTLLRSPHIHKKSMEQFKQEFNYSAVEFIFENNTFKQYIIVFNFFLKKLKKISGIIFYIKKCNYKIFVYKMK